MGGLVISGGRVVDPASGMDAIGDVAVLDGQISAVGTGLGSAERVIDATGLVVAPGFIDLHAHGQSIPADRMQAFDGMKECEVYGAMMQAMTANGGEEPTLFLWNCDRYPYPHPFRMPTVRPMEKGDLIICEMHPKYGGYFTHVERTYCLGEPEQQQLKIYEGCLAAYRCGLEHFGPGKTISTALMAVKAEIDSRGLAICEAGIHGHGLASLEYPRFRHHAIDADRDAIKVIGDRFEVGMVFAFSIDLLDPNWREGKTGCVFAETIEITPTGASRMHTFPTEFQRLPH